MARFPTGSCLVKCAKLSGFGQRGGVDEFIHAALLRLELGE
jgi:hypothetical protein